MQAPHPLQPFHVMHNRCEEIVRMLVGANDWALHALFHNAVRSVARNDDPAVVRALWTTVIESEIRWPDWFDSIDWWQPFDLNLQEVIDKVAAGIEHGID